MRPYLATLSARFRSLLQYRAAAAAGFGCQLFWGLIRMMIFSAFLESGAPSPMSREHVIAYIWLGQAFLLLLPFRTDSELEQMIRSGNISSELLRPVDLYWFWFSRGIANRVAPTMLRSIPMLVIASVVGWIFWPGVHHALACAAALAGAVLLGSALATLMTITMFWTISGQGIARLLGVSAYFLSGVVVPLPLFPDWLQPVLNALPFRGLGDVPFRLFTGHMPVADLYGALAHQLAWAAGLALAGQWLLSRATRRLVIQGG